MKKFIEDWEEILFYMFIGFVFDFLAFYVLSVL
jgi:hypothetical protein